MTAIGARYYRLALGAAKRRDLRTALVYADFACILGASYFADTAYLGDTGYSQDAARFGDAAHLEDAEYLADAERLAEICRYELGEEDAREPELEAVGLLVRQKKWKAAALAARGLPHQSVRILMVQGCLWALARDDARAMDCFAGALTKDRGNRLAADALAEIARRRRCFWRIF
jgi:hypothetical protein